MIVRRRRLRLAGAVRPQNLPLVPGSIGGSLPKVQLRSDKAEKDISKEADLPWILSKIYRSSGLTIPNNPLSQDRGTGMVSRIYQEVIPPTLQVTETNRPLTDKIGNWLKTGSFK